MIKIPIIKSATRRTSIMNTNIYGGGGPDYMRVQSKKPTVVRKGDKVKRCFFFDGTGDCLGIRCFWASVGSCPTFTKIHGNGRKTNGKKKVKKR